MSADSAPSPDATATAPAPAVVASPQKVGFLARMVGSENTIRELENRIATEQATVASLSTQLAASQARVAEFEALEASLEADLTAARAAAESSAQAAATAQATVATVPQQVAAGVADVVATLGVPETSLAAVSAEPPKDGQQFSHLTGRERAAAAFTAQLTPV